MRIAVTTPTGNVGSRVVRLLVQAGVRPVLLLRDPGKLDPQLRELVDTETGDLGDADHVRRATAGADALYWVDPTDLTSADPNAESARLGGIAAAAITANGIGHTVFQSSVGAEKRAGAGLLDGLGAVEETLDATGLPVLHLRCGYFFTNLLADLDSIRSGTLTTPWAPDEPLPWVDPRDVGDVAAARLLAADWTGRQVQAVHGPADLTWTEVVEVLAAVTGRPLELAQVGDDDLRAGLLAAGLQPGAADQVVGMSAGLRDFTPEQERSALSTTPTTLAAWAAQHLRPALAG